MPTFRQLSPVLLAALAFAPLASAQATTNLSAQGYYADPEIRIFDGQYWIYPTTSDPNPNVNAHRTFNPLQTKLRSGPVIHPVYLLHTSLDAFSSPDLVHWTKHRDILDILDVPWAAYAIWAPSAIHLNGKYYLFFAANDLQKTSTFLGGIGEAVSDHPGGPFRDALGHPLIGEFHNGAQPIDPMIFQDDDGGVYFYYGGQGHCNVVRLSPDLTRIIPMPDGTLYKEITPPGYVEGPFMIKRHGVYYFMWSQGDWGNSTYGVAYARGSSPVGPFTPVGKILSTDARIADGPGHHSILHIPSEPGDTSTRSALPDNNWYIVYHRHPLGTTGPNQRVMAIDQLHFNPDGTIQPVQMTKDGPGPHPLPAAAPRQP